METKKTRKVHSPEFKAKPGVEALNGYKTNNEIGPSYGLHPVQVGQWKNEIQEQAKTLFENQCPDVATYEASELLYGQIGRLKVALDWLKKNQG